MGHGHRCSTLANLFLHTVHTFPDSLAPPSSRLYKALRAIFDSHRRSLFFTQRASLTSTKNISRTETRSTTFTNRREIDKRILVGFNKFLHAYSVQVLHVAFPPSFLPTFFRISYVEIVIYLGIMVTIKENLRSFPAIESYYIRKLDGGCQGYLGPANIRCNGVI